MQDGKLTRDESIALLRKLSSDDAFRATFEKEPAAALKQIGIGSGDVAALPPTAAAAMPLPPKEQFQQALQETLDSGTSKHMCLVFPLLKLTYGDADSSAS
jgi:putative modified peptide